MSTPATAPACDHCGEPATRKDWLTQQPCCDACGRSEDDEPDGDHPIGGMGFGIDYSEALSEARGLK